jgi:S-adenosylmethionine:tRNA ribosyltransferase-isomerase
MNEKIIHIADFDYSLPDSKIARYPLSIRDESALLVYNKGVIGQTIFNTLAQNFNEKDLLVFNNTRVVPARLIFRKDTGAIIEVLCLEPHEPTDYQQSFEKRGKVQWKCMVGNAGKWKEGKICVVCPDEKQDLSLKAEIIQRNEAGFIIEFSWKEEMSFSEILIKAGHVPIPPYLSREDEKIDKIRYQTIFSEIDGSVAAPTAGLHFTENVFGELKQKKCSIENVTLHVGAGTFLPVKSENAANHIMHGERFTVTRQALENIIKHKGNVTAVGTTAVRTLETLYWLGVKCLEGKDFNNLDQWEAYHLSQNITIEKAFASLLENSGKMIEAETRIMIVPGYRFRVVDKLITNFHQPRSTLLLLVSAFLGEENWKKVYDYALKNNFRFLSYGDSSLLIP